MPVFELTKSIESIRLNKRNRLPAGDPPRTVPFGALIDDVSERGDRAHFVYLGELYECSADLLRSALPASAAVETESAPPAATTESNAAVNGKPKAPAALVWEPLQSNDGAFSRARVPGGWLVRDSAHGLAFVPDPGKSW